MNYELALALKNAGFPQEGNGISYDVLTSAGVYEDNVFRENVYYPTLEELIEACGDKFAELSRGNSQVDAPWTASGFPIKLGNAGQGKTPLEAVAHLWLALNKTKS